MGVFQHAFQRVRVGHEVGRDVALVELHPLDHFFFGLEALALLDLDDALSPDFVEGLGQQPADLVVAVGTDGTDLGDVIALNLNGLPQNALDGRTDRGVDASLDRHGVGARGDVLETFGIDRLGQHGGRGRPVAYHVARLAGDLVDHLGAHVLEGIG